MSDNTELIRKAREWAAGFDRSKGAERQNSAYYIKALADELEAAKPRQVTTASELNALGFYAVILDAYDTPHVCERWATDKSRAEWAQAGTNALIDSEDVLYHGPATVLYSPVVAP